MQGLVLGFGWASQHQPASGRALTSTGHALEPRASREVRQKLTATVQIDRSLWEVFYGARFSAGVRLGLTAPAGLRPPFGSD